LAGFDDAILLLIKKQASKAATIKTLNENFTEKTSIHFFNMVILQYNKPVE
jgi:hypothetical protein